MKSEGPQVSGLEGWTWELSGNGIYENNREVLREGAGVSKRVLWTPKITFRA